MHGKPITDDDLRALTARWQTERRIAPEDPLPEPVSHRCRVCDSPIRYIGLAADRRMILAWNSLADGTPRMTCRACRDAAEAAEAAAKREQQIASMRQARERELEGIRAAPEMALLDAGVPSHWQRASFDHCPDLPPDLIETVRQWAGNPQGMLYLYGAAGAGKTFVAVGALRHVLTEGIIRPGGALFVSERAFLDELKASFDADAPAAPVADRMLPPAHPRRVALLLYDDLGAARLTDWSRGEIAGLLEARHATDLPTIITSNLAPGALAQAVDGRVASRIAESRTMLEFPRRDLRVNGTVRELPV